MATRFASESPYHTPIHPVSLAGLPRVRLTPEDVRKSTRSVGSLTSSEQAQKVKWNKKSAILTVAVVSSVTVVIADTLRFVTHLPPGWQTRWNKMLSSSGIPRLGIPFVARDPLRIYDRKRELVAAINTTKVPLQALPDHVWQAVVASEDRRFFNHNGVDKNGMLRAVFSIGLLGGGSTITQQVIKNMVLCPSRTLSRKIMEGVLAMELERRLTKEEILQVYLNSIYWGHGTWGIAAAAGTYLDKPVEDVTRGEAAMLAGILPSPENLTPKRNPGRAVEKAKWVQCCMERDGLYTPAPSEQLYDCPHIQPAEGAFHVPGVPYRAPHFVREVVRQLSKSRRLCPDGELAGLKVYTTLDLGFQERLESLIASFQTQPPVGCEIAVVALHARSSGVKGIVSGRNPYEGGCDRALRWRWGAGKAIVPIIELVGIGNTSFTPESGGNNGKTSAKSAHQMTLLEIGNFFNALNSDGIWSRPFLITEVRDSRGKLLYRFKNRRKRVIKRNAASRAKRCLVAQSGGHRSAEWTRSCTEKSFWHAWSSGDTTTGVWVGRDDGGSLSPQDIDWANSVMQKLRLL